MLLKHNTFYCSCTRPDISYIMMELSTVTTIGNRMRRQHEEPEQDQDVEAVSIIPHSSCLYRAVCPSALGQLHAARNHDDRPVHAYPALCIHTPRHIRA